MNNQQESHSYSNNKEDQEHSPKKIKTKNNKVQFQKEIIP
jgi:hypothetical protein